MTEAFARDGDRDPTAEPVLETIDVSVRFGGLAALTDVSVAVPAGHSVGLVGPNGAGKSTLFGVCSGFVLPTRGTVRLLGRDVTKANPQKRARMGLARSFQQPELFESLTIAQHFALAHRLHFQRGRLWSDLFDFKGWRPPDRHELVRVDEIIQLLGLEVVANDVALNLPTGLARLVEVGRALAASPRILMLDEPAAGLDHNEREELSRVLGRVIERENVALLLVEHDLQFVLGLCSLVYVLDSGVLIGKGSPDEIRKNSAVRSAYLGSDPAMTMIE